MAKVTQLHKSNDTINTENYRLTIVSTTLSMTLEKEVHAQIKNYLQSHGRLSKNLDSEEIKVPK